jgi:hypothetical protein
LYRGIRKLLAGIDKLIGNRKYTKGVIIFYIWSCEKVQNKRKNWTRDELVVAFNLYCRISFGRIHKSNPEIIRISEKIKRTPSAVAMKYG